MRMMTVFEKGFALRHISHLDLVRAMQRALRRSGLPVAYSQGFNPHIQMSFASPLAVGVVGLREVMDVPVSEEIPQEEWVDRLNRVLPGGLQVWQARSLEDTFPTLMAWVAASRYTLKMDKGGMAQAIIDKLPDFMALSDYQALRKTKSGEAQCNIRPFVLRAEAKTEGEEAHIRCLLFHTPAGTLKPSLLMKSLFAFAGMEETPYLAVREAILAREKDGTLTPLEEALHE